MITDYGVRVMINAAHITNETSDVDPADFEGDDFIVASRLDAVREQMVSDPKYDRRIEDVLKAMEMIDLDMMQAARFFAALNMISDQRKGH